MKNTSYAMNVSENTILYFSFFTFHFTIYEKLP